MTTKHNHRLSDAELAWLWPRYQRCSFPIWGLPKQFAKNDISQLTEAGRLTACDLAFQYRRQIFGQRAVKWTFWRFLSEVGALCGSPPTCHICGKSGPHSHQRRKSVPVATMSVLTVAGIGKP